MKRTLIFAALMACVLLFVACKSTGEVNDETFRKVYNRYRSQLIMEGAQKYTVKSGDTLSEISRTFYDDPYFYPVIMLASSDVVLDPDKINPGMELNIPDLQANLNNPGARRAMKSVIIDCAKIEEKRNRPVVAQHLKARADKL
ncbi:MAG: LysM peptidoglycan-binding domain-containing protein [Treponema sp.]|nr:LysM peptidoglycan-binding domain-containing protein [Treponema sp.]